jgi:hypothetical protein
LSEDFHDEGAKLVDCLEASRIARCDVLNTTNHVNGIRVTGYLYDEGAVSRHHADTVRSAPLRVMKLE